MKERLFILLQYALPKHFVSRCTGWLAESTIPWLKNVLIKNFIKQFDVDMTEAANEDPEYYENFNHFFTRSLKDGARPIDDDAKSIISPCDGAISELGKIDAEKIIQAKGIYYTLNKLLGGEAELAQKFVDGEFINCYLSPKDYHRVHMPLDGKLTRTIYVPGELFSVNPTTAQNIPDLFARNERLICEFETELGTMAFIMVGAVIVAGIETVWAGQVAPPPKTVQIREYNKQPEEIFLNKGDELGRFMLGSTVVMLFEKDKVKFAEELANGSSLRMGEAIAKTI